MMDKKNFTLFRVWVLALTIIPQTGMTAFADNGDPALVSGGSALSKGANSSGAQILKYGGKDWYVMDYKGKNVRLLAKENLGKTQYNNTATNHYGKSVLKTKVEAIAGAFSSGEKGAITTRNLTGGNPNAGQPGYNGNNISGDTVNGAYLWPLSYQEASSLNENLRNENSKAWWLRSPGYYDYLAANINGSYVLPFGTLVTTELGVRPAFDLNLESVIFTSAAAGGKSSGDPGANALQPIGSNSTNEWKVTVKDTAHDGFAIVTSETGYDSETGVATVFYEGAQTGKDEFISAVIKDNQGAITYYGRIAASSSETGSVTINTKDKLKNGDELYVFNEQYHSDASTDYASELKVIPLQPPAHTWSEEWSTDGDKHWHECSVCHAKSDEAAHTWSEEWSADGDNHWHKCSVCQIKKDETTHTWSEKWSTDGDKCI